MHILIIPSEEYIPKHNPIAGIFQHDQAKILQQEGHQISAFSFTFNYSLASLFRALLGKTNASTKGLSFFQIVKLIFQKTFVPFNSCLSYQTINHINVIRCDGFWGLKSSKVGTKKLELWNKYAAYTLKMYIKKHGKPDLIHAHNMIYAGLTAAYLKKTYNIPIVITEHSSEYAMQTINTEIQKKITHVLNTEKNIFAVSPKLIELLTNKFSLTKTNNIKWLPNVLDPLVENTPFTPRKLNDNKTVRFLNVGNLIPLKGQKELIIAFNKAFKNTNNVELIIAGKGPLKKELQELIQQLNLSSKIKLIGLISRSEVIKQMDLCNIFVLPSHYETFGVVLIEALSRGIPVISTFCGGPECIVNKNNGILVAPKNVEELTNALITMHKNYTTYNQNKLRENCLNQFGKATFSKSLIQIYRNTICK